MRISYKLVLLLSCFSIVLSFVFGFTKIIHKKNQLTVRMIGPKTKAIFEKLDKYENEVGGAGGSSSLIGLERLDNIWNDLKNGGWARQPPKIVHDDKIDMDYHTNSEYDIIGIIIHNHSS